MERAPYGTLADLGKRIEARKARGGNVSQASRLLSEARACEGRAASLAAAGKPEEAEAAQEEAGVRADAAYCATVASRPGEFRGVWMTPTLTTDWDEVMGELEEGGLNAIFPNLNNGGSAMYPSEVLPRNADYADQDMLGECLAAAEHHGIEVHVWRINWALFWGTPEDFIDRLRREGRLQLNPKGKPLSETGEWYKCEAMCPSHEENRRLEREAMLELVRRWPVAGIHFDYMRFPSDDQCFCPTCRERFQREMGARATNWPRDCLRGGELLGAWRQWRRDLITSLTAEISLAAHRIRPGVQVSLAARSGVDWTWHADGQDWPRWVREGYLDFICPMDYTDDLPRLRQALERQQALVAGRVPLFVGHGIVRSPATLAACIELGREMGADGFLYFDYKGVREWLPTLRLGPTEATPAVPYRAPQVSFELIGGVAAEGAVRCRYRQGSEVEARVQVAPSPTLPGELKKAEAEVVLETAQGEVLERLGRFEAPPWAAHIFRFLAPERRWRLMVSGEMELACAPARLAGRDGPTAGRDRPCHVPYTVRGPLCEST